MIKRILIALSVAILAVIFAVQNSQQVAVNFFGLAFEGSLALILLLTFTVGLLGGLVFILPPKVRRYWKGDEAVEEISEPKAEEKIEE